MGVPLEQRALRRRLTEDDSLRAVGGAFQGGRQRSAQLYRAADGFAFEKPGR
jgi:hypothetical protein